MRYPNLLIAGVQKAGTTWLHQTLSFSKYFFGSPTKELNVFGHAKFAERIKNYGECFCNTQKEEARFFFEATPHYFQAPNELVDIAQQIRDHLEEVRIIVVLRNPVERYRSAYVHHIERGRLAYTPIIHEVTEKHIMLSAGMQGEILSHWKNIFPDILCYSHDDMRANPYSFIKRIFDDLNVPCDLHEQDLPAPIHTATHKRRRAEWAKMPMLDLGTRKELIDIYKNDIKLLSELVDFPVTHWLDEGTVETKNSVCKNYIENLKILKDRVWR